jgi:hypothetical protein
MWRQWSQSRASTMSPWLARGNYHSNCFGASLQEVHLCSKEASNCFGARSSSTVLLSVRQPVPTSMVARSVSPGPISTSGKHPANMSLAQGMPMVAMGGGSCLPDWGGSSYPAMTMFSEWKAEMGRFVSCGGMKSTILMPPTPKKTVLPLSWFLLEDCSS